MASGVHQLLLSCAADTHALLALKAFHPSQPATPSMAEIARTDHKQAKAAGRAAGTSAKRRSRHTVVNGLQPVAANGGERQNLVKLSSESHKGQKDDIGRMLCLAIPAAGLQLRWQKMPSTNICWHVVPCLQIVPGRVRSTSLWV